MKITYYGHSSFAAEINGKHLLFDPFITQNPLAEAVDIKKIKTDYIFVSHAHFDHITDAAAIAARPGRIKCEVATDLPHPRHYTIKTSPEFMALKARLTEEIRVEALAAARR